LVIFMLRLQSAIAIFCIALQSLHWTAAAQDNPPGSTRIPALSREKGGLSQLVGNYQASAVSPINEGNTTRLDSLLRGGNLYLSMEDAIALAIENNIYVEVQRYGPLITDANLQRARAGGALRTGLPTVQSGPSSAPLSQAPNFITIPTSTFPINSFLQPSGVLLFGLDPILSGSYQYQYSSAPQSNTVVTGTNVLIDRTYQGQVTYSQNFLTGTSVSLGYTDLQLDSNASRAQLNPYRSAAASLNVTQHLLQGFGMAVNNRMIQIARNGREMADLQFKQQVIVIVASAMNLYWDLVSFNDDVRAKQESLEYNQWLYDDAKRLVAIGTLASIEVIRADAAVAGSQQDLIISETRVLQQETILKDFVSRNGVASPAVEEAHIVPTDRIRVPEVEAIQPYQDLVARALSGRPEMAIARIRITNAKINLRGSKGALLPTLDVFGNLANNGLAGAVNSLSASPVQGAASLIGGYGDLLSQIFDRSFPNYTLGLQVNIPIFNRVARADYALDQITERQQELALLAAEKQVRVDVQNAIIGLRQARATYQASVKQRILQEETLDGEQRKLNLGASTTFNVILVERDLATARAAEVAALSNYSKARVQLDFSTAQTLANNNISIAEAFEGKISRPPSPLPPRIPGRDR
jgi:outer membrane protein TolC